MIFKPKFSILAILVQLFLVFSMIFVIFLTLTIPAPLLVTLIVIIPIIGIFGTCLFFLLIYPTMKYTLEKEGLKLTCGFLSSTIPYSDISTIIKTDLKYHPTSTGWELPGYALFKVYHADRGWVRMYSTAALKNILLIETKNETYGITPKDEEDFLRELKKRLPK